MNTLRDIIEKSFGVKTDIVESVVTITTSQTLILQNNPNRLSYIISVAGSNTAYFSGKSNVTSSGNGIPVGGGNSLAARWDVDFDIVGYDLYGVASTGSISLYIREVVAVS